MKLIPGLPKKQEKYAKTLSSFFYGFFALSSYDFRYFLVCSRYAAGALSSNLMSARSRQCACEETCRMQCLEYRAFDRQRRIVDDGSEYFSAQ